MLVPHKCVSPNYLLEKNLYTLEIIWRHTDVSCPNYISYPFKLSYLASTLVCIAQIILISITLVVGHQLACDVLGIM